MYGDKHQSSGRTPLHSAAESGQAQMVQVLLESGADVAAEDEARGARRDRAHTAHCTAQCAAQGCGAAFFLLMR